MGSLKADDLHKPPQPNGTAIHEALATVADALARLRYGAVHLTVHDGKVVQVDVTERQRFT
jgi:hypothetical protein